MVNDAGQGKRNETGQRRFDRVHLTIIMKEEIFMGNKRTFDTVFLLQIALGLFFIVLGVLSLIDYDSLGGGSVIDSEVLQVLISVAFIICGLVLLAALFLPVKAGTLQIAIISIFVLWLVLLVVNNFIDVNFKSMDVFSRVTDAGEKAAITNILNWVYQLCVDLVMLCSIWVIRVRRYL